MTDNTQPYHAFGNTHCWRCRQAHRKEDGSTLGSTEQLRILKYLTYGWRGGTYVHMSVRFAEVLQQVLRGLPFGIRSTIWEVPTMGRVSLWNVPDTSGIAFGIRYVARGSMSSMKAERRPSLGRGGDAGNCAPPAGILARQFPHRRRYLSKRYLSVTVRGLRKYLDWIGFGSSYHLLIYRKFYIFLKDFIHEIL